MVNIVCNNLFTELFVSLSAERVSLHDVGLAIIIVIVKVSSSLIVSEGKDSLSSSVSEEAPISSRSYASPIASSCTCMHRGSELASSIP